MLLFQKYFFLNLKYSLGCSVFSGCLVLSGLDFGEKVEFILSMLVLHFHSKHSSFSLFY